MTDQESNRYRNGKIYTIRYKGDDSLIYVGSTCLPLHKRWYKHKIACFNENIRGYDSPIYKKIRETNNLDDWYIELYEDYPTERKELLLRREGEITREIGTLNIRIEDRTRKEWQDDNKDRIKDYYIKNKESIVQRYNDNKDLFLEKHKKYYDDNKTDLNEKRKIKITCSCGCELRKSDLRRHEKSQKHISLMKEKEEK